MRKFLAPFVATAAAALVLTGCGKAEGPPQMPAPQVSVANPLRQSVVDWDDFTGRFEGPAPRRSWRPATWPAPRAC